MNVTASATTSPARSVCNPAPNRTWTMCTIVRTTSSASAAVFAGAQGATACRYRPNPSARRPRVGAPNPTKREIQPERNPDARPERARDVDVLAARARHHRAELGVDGRAREREQPGRRPDRQHERR